MLIEKFNISIPDSVISDLHRRIRETRWPDEIHGANWQYGTDLSYMKNLATYWIENFDWRIEEQKLNSFSQFHATIDGIKIHFIHERGKHSNSIPLLLTHGWPSSFVEMTKIIPLLTDPSKFGGDYDFSFDVIVPSIPGFGFSDKPIVQGCGVQKISDLFLKLVTKTLGYSEFFAHGSDWGTSITACLGFKYPKNVRGVHLTSVTGGTPSSPYPNMEPLSYSEEQYLQNRSSWLDDHGAYAHMQRTTPQTYAYGLNDSPIGLAALLVEKFRAWSDCNGDIQQKFSLDELLCNITLYWVTQTIHSSMRIYYEADKSPWILKSGELIEIPCAIAHFPKEMSQPLREWGEHFYNIQRWTSFPSGGHFPAVEEPVFLARDIYEFVKSLRSRGSY